MRRFSATNRSTSPSTDAGLDRAVAAATDPTRSSLACGTHGRRTNAALIGPGYGPFRDARTGRSPGLDGAASYNCRKRSREAAVVAERLQEELDALAIRLGRSLTIDSVDGELIAYSTQRDDTDTARVSAILLRRVPVEICDWQARYIGLDSAAPVRVPANP